MTVPESHEGEGVVVLVGEMGHRTPPLSSRQESFLQARNRRRGSPGAGMGWGEQEGKELVWGRRSTERKSLK